jgi:KaiC/GvpD/RAD55 family RecA-like ATPase
MMIKDLMRQEAEQTSQTQEKPENGLKDRLLTSLEAPPKIVKTKYRELNRLLDGGLRQGLCSTMFGPPGNAKSFLAMNFVGGMIDNKSANPYYLPLEYNKVDHVRRGLGVMIGSWGFTSEDQKKKAFVVDWLKNDKLSEWWINSLDDHIAENPTGARRDESGDLIIPKADYPKILDIVSKQAETRDFIVIDPITAIDADDRSRKNQYDQQADFVRAVNAIAEESDTHVQFITHSSRRQTHKGKAVDLTMDSAGGTIALSRFTQYIFILDYHKGGANATVMDRAGIIKNVDYTRTLILDKVTAGCGAGTRMAMDFNHGPQLDILGILQ